MREHRGYGIWSILGALTVAGIVAGGPTARADDPGFCVTAAVPEAYTLPDGSRHPAGRITVCPTEFTPAVDFQRVRTTDQGSLILVSRRKVVEFNANSRPWMVFLRRRPGAPIDLVEYVAGDGHRTWRYVLQTIGAAPGADVVAAARAKPGEETVVLVASIVTQHTVL